MRLSGNISILFEDEVITEQTLEAYRTEWRVYAILPGIGKNRLSDKEIVYALLSETIPFTITGSGNGDPLVLKALFRKFPYAIDGKFNYASFGLCLVPEQGNVQSIELNDDRKVAINTLSINTDRVSADLGNGSLHLEIFLRPTETEIEILPPDGFQREYTLKDTGKCLD